MQFSYENIRIKKYVNILVSSLTALAGALASYSSENIEPAYKNFMKTVAPNILSSNDIFLEIIYYLSLSALLYVLSNKLLIKIAERALELRSDLNGWWIYGFKVKDFEISTDLKEHNKPTDFDNSGDNEFYVVGKFQIIHKVTGISVKGRGQSDYLVLPSNAKPDPRLLLRGTWIPYDMICNQEYSELWIIYHFEKKEMENLSYYDGLMKLSNTGRNAIMKGTNWYAEWKKWLRKHIEQGHWIYRWALLIQIRFLNLISHKNYLYQGVIQDLNRRGIRFSPIFAEKIPNHVKYVDDIDEIIIQNFDKIKQTIDELNHTAK